MNLVVEDFDYTPSFAAALAAAPADLQQAARDALEMLQKNPKARSLRCHPLPQYGKPMIFKIDVYTNKSWQISFEMSGRTAVLRRLDTHKELDWNPR